MITGLLGKKIGMSRLFKDDGRILPITILQIQPAQVVQKKTIAKDGYNALQLGFNPLADTKAKKKNKAYIGHFKNNTPFGILKEFKSDKIEEVEVGHDFDISLFKTGDFIDVSGISKGRGFAGVVKRHGFAGGPASHGHRFHRTTGSIGNRKFPGRVFKNKRMPGHMGHERVTIQNLSVAEVDDKNNCILVHGAVPGPNGSYVEVKLAVKKPNIKK